ncbi:DNA repair protein RecO [Candidatus Saccharibacteria bacterium]|nr:DNA repair protein RecO [Candidatus Saccharibacteria bacterium]
MKTIKTSAIVLRRTNYGEADRVLQLLTPEGKLSVIARGVRREKSKLAGGIELFALCDVNIANGKGEIGTLISSRLAHYFSHIVEDYDKTKFAYEVIRLVSAIGDSVDGPEWYDTLAEVLAGLDSKSISLNMVKIWFYLRYEALLGYEFNLLTDTRGDKLESNKKYHYDMNEKTLAPDEAGLITGEHIKLLRLIAAKPLKIIAQIGGAEAISGDCLTVVLQHSSI